MTHPRHRRTGWVLWVTASLGVGAGVWAGSAPAQSSPERGATSIERPTFADAQRLFYNARYLAAASLTLTLRASDAADLASDELRTSALLFELKVLLEGPAAPDRDKKKALQACATCQELMTEFLADIRHGQNLAREILREHPGDPTALFFLGKLDLNYIWLQLGPLGRKTGWDEYWEARRSLDAVLKQEPRHVRAMVARAWIDYIVDTRMPWGTRWILGGGNKKRALAALAEAVRLDANFFDHAEAEFGLWNMLVRENKMTEATDVARRLARDFPENREVVGFLQARESRIPQ